MNDFIYRFMPKMGNTAIMTSEELATIYHFPSKAVATPNIHFINAKRAPAAAHVATTGLYLGKSTYRGLSRVVFKEIDDIFGEFNQKEVKEE